MTISLTDRSSILDGIANLARVIERLRHEEGSLSVGDQLQQAREILRARLAPSGVMANFDRHIDIFDSLFSPAEKEALYELWLGVHTADWYAFAIPRTPLLVLAKLERIATTLRQPQVVSNATSNPALKPATNTDTSSVERLEAKALAVFLSHPDWSKAQIAVYLQCNERSLRAGRCPILDRIMEFSHAQNALDRLSGQEKKGTGDHEEAGD
jgi:hypothetical protein